MKKTNKYDLNIREEQLKNEVRDDFFYNFDNSKIIQDIDFSIAVKSTDKNQDDFFEMPFLLKFFEKLYAIYKLFTIRIS